MPRHSLGSYYLLPGWSPAARLRGGSSVQNQTLAPYFPLATVGVMGSADALSAYTDVRHTSAVFDSLKVPGTGTGNSSGMSKEANYEI